MSAPDIVITVTRRFDHPPERVYDSWLDPRMIRRFMFTNGTAVKIEVDARIGGGFVVVDRRPDGDAEHYGRYTALDRPRRIAFDFATASDMSDASPVVIDIRPDGDGCSLTLTHRIGAQWRDYEDRTRRGWSSMVENLGNALA